MSSGRVFLFAGAGVFLAGAVWLGRSLLTDGEAARPAPAERRPSPLAHRLPVLPGAAGDPQPAPGPDPAPEPLPPGAPTATPTPAAAPAAPTPGEFAGPAPTAPDARAGRIHELLTTRARVAELAHATDEKSRAEVAELRPRLVELERWATDNQPAADELAAAQARIDELRAAPAQPDTH